MFRHLNERRQARSDGEISSRQTYHRVQVAVSLSLEGPEVPFLARPVSRASIFRNLSPLRCNGVLVSSVKIKLLAWETERYVRKLRSQICLTKVPRDCARFAKRSQGVLHVFQLWARIKCARKAFPL